MLNFSINVARLEEDFDRIAQELLCGYVLQVGFPDTETSARHNMAPPMRYQLTEVEFYYNNSARTLDSFAHHHTRYYPSGTWRLHGAGLDIVLSKEGEYHGGILLRGLQPLDAKGQPTADYIDGPWNSATRCIGDKGSVTVPLPFYLHPLAKPFEVAIKKSPRVGLFLRKVEDLKYICQPWRYSSMPLRSHRYRQLLFLQAHVNQDPSAQQLGLSARAQTNYLHYFEEGRQMVASDFVNGGTGVRHTCRLFGYCYQHDLTR